MALSTCACLLTIHVKDSVNLYTQIALQITATYVQCKTCLTLHFCNVPVHTLFTLLHYFHTNFTGTDVFAQYCLINSKHIYPSG